MGTRVLEVAERSDLRKWVAFPYELYRGHPFHVPQLYREELSYFDRDRNPNFEVTEVALFLAVREGKAVGRLCASMSALEAEKLGWKRGRFGWFDVVEDQDVVDALLERAEAWLRGRGCIEMQGPYGLTDLDPEGVLVEGFDHLPTISGSYNHPYYGSLLEAHGLEKAVDYVEYRSVIPRESTWLERLGRRVTRDGEFHVREFRSRKELLSQADAMWSVLQAAFEPLPGVVPLTKKQADYYTKKYFGFLDPDFVKMAYSRTGEMVGFFIAIPNLSRAFRKAKGRLFPTGLYHILRDYRRPETVDFMLAGAKPGEPSGPILALMASEMFDTLCKRGVQYMETNRELEENTAVNQIWRKFETAHFRRSRIYEESLE